MLLTPWLWVYWPRRSVALDGQHREFVTKEFSNFVPPSARIRRNCGMCFTEAASMSSVFNRMKLGRSSSGSGTELPAELLAELAAGLEAAACEKAKERSEELEGRPEGSALSSLCPDGEPQAFSRHAASASSAAMAVLAVDCPLKVPPETDCLC